LFELMSRSTSSYRPDIDGLRAIAVLSVILFHFAHQNLPGGFLGVDIFFVLSGYLITQIIHGEIVAHRFTIRGFYERRVRRIMPALLLVLACSSGVAALILLPSDLVGFGKALLATLGFFANMYAWRDTNYFSPLADQKPLLHTWSLGVEEQFYIFFPLVLWLLARRWPRLVLPAIILTTLGSFALDVLGQRAGANTFAFFSLPTRAWELGIGAIIALAPRAKGDAAVGWVNLRSLGAVLGLALIATGLFFPKLFDRPIPNPVLAVLGTALIVWIGQSARTPIARLLAFAPLVWVGLISYSLYLWHWPVIVFSKYWLVRDLRPIEIGAAWIFMFLAAWLSWRFIERPFRSREYPVRKLYIGSAVGTLVLAIVGFVLIQSRGLPGRLSAEAAVINEAVNTHFHCPLETFQTIGPTRGCPLHLPSGNPDDAHVVLLGNSHAQMYAPVWRGILEERGETGVMIPLNACLPTVTINLSTSCVRRAKVNQDAVDALPNVRTVVLSMTWWHGTEKIVDASGNNVDNTGKAAMITALDDVIAHFHARGRRVVLVGPIATPGWNVASDLSRLLAYGRKVERPLAMPRARFDAQYAAVIAHFSGRDDVIFVRPDLIQCDAANCHYVIDGHALFSDENHMAAAAVERFRGIFAAAL
jgi:peptidoglycan/LPS O-acetylase OafA/YrhL